MTSNGSKRTPTNHRYVLLLEPETFDRVRLVASACIVIRQNGQSLV